MEKEIKKLDVHEEQLIQDINAGKIVFTLRDKGELIHAETFNSFDELKEKINKEYVIGDSDYLLLTAEEGRIHAANQEYSEQMQDLLHDDDDFNSESFYDYMSRKSESYKKAKSYHEILENHKIEDYALGLYDSLNLILPIDSSASVHTDYYSYEGRMVTFTYGLYNVI